MTRLPFDRRRSGSSRRQHASRRRKTTVLIVCEGRETERNYFDQLKRDEPTRQNFAITVKRGKGGSRQQIAQFAVDRRNDGGDDYDHVWCVMDVESPEDLDAMRRALELLEANSISAALSNPAFEVWLLAHFEKTGKCFLNCDQVIAQLTKHWQTQFSADYDKADAQIYQRLAPLTEQAIANAKWVHETHHAPKSCIIDCNSATDVYRLVGPLRGVAAGANG
jgi:hypothetical protein